MDWTNTVILVALTIAIVNRIKSEAPKIKGSWYTLIAFGVGAILYFIGLYAPAAITVPLAIGITASGIFDIYKQK